MAIRTFKRVCLSCKHYRPTHISQGKCRLGRGTIDPSDYPFMNHEDGCESWKDAGQQYHIRVGWIRNMKDRKDGDEPGDKDF